MYETHTGTLTDWLNLKKPYHDDLVTFYIDGGTDAYCQKHDFPGILRPLIRQQYILNVFIELNMVNEINGIDRLIEIPYRQYLKTREWRVRRVLVKNFVNYQCQLCAHRTANTRYDYLEVHHNNYDRIGRELITDLVALCTECHTSYHVLQSRKRRDIKYYAEAMLSQL